MTLLFLILFLNQAQATPGRVEVWFLSEASAKSSFFNHINNYKMFFSFIHTSYLSQSSFDANCIPMGEGCFHPQLGMVVKDQNVLGKSVPDKNKESEHKTINSFETDLIECDKNYYFDLYCGKTLKNIAKKEGLEIWIDNSGSFKGIDIPKAGDICFRQSFAEKLRNACQNHVSFSTFNTSIKPISDLSVACQSVGGNDTNRIIQWISNSKAFELIIITDSSEYNEKLEIYLNSIGAQTKGIGAKFLKASDLDQFLNEVKGRCLN